MTLLEDLENGAVDGSTDLAQLLRQCHVLGARTGVDALEEWVHYELDGYPKEVAVPDYRRVPMAVKGDFVGVIGGGVSQIKSQVVTAAELPDDTWRKNFGSYDVREGIAVVASLEQSGDEVTIEAGDLASVLQWRRFNCTAAWGAISSTHYFAILNTVRNRVLRLATSLRKKHPEAGEKQESDSSAGREITQTIVNVIGDGPVNIGGTGNMAVSAHTIAVGDLDALKRALSGAGVPDDGVAELEAAIKEDGAPKEMGALGTRVTGWLKKAAGKIADGVWKVTTDAATKFATTSLNSYYGFDN